MWHGPRALKMTCMSTSPKGRIIMRKRSLTGLAGLAAVPVVALALASCGTSGSGSSAATTSPASSAATTSPASTTAGSSAQQGTVDAGSTNLGSILVDSQGRTLYLFQADSGT